MKTAKEIIIETLQGEGLMYAYKDFADDIKDEHIEKIADKIVKNLNIPAVMPSLPYEKVIKDRAEYFRKIMQKYEAQRLEECLRTIKELIPPENWNVGNGA